MSATVDANILVYASNHGDPVHAQARQLVRLLAAGPDLLYLFWPVVLGYLRIVTHSAILRRPPTPAEPAANADQLLKGGPFRRLGRGDGSGNRFGTTSRDQARGNDVPAPTLVP